MAILKELSSTLKSLRVYLLMASALAVGCNTNKPHDEAGVPRTSIDLSEVVSAYDKNEHKCDVQYDNEKVNSLLLPFEDNESPDTFYLELYDKEPFTYEFPEYRQSKHPFLQQAEDIFNSCIIANGIWSNIEAWDRFYEIGDQYVANCTSQIHLDCLRDEGLRQAAAAYRDGVADLLLKVKDVESDEFSPLSLKDRFTDIINEKWYKYCDDQNKLLTLLTERHDSLSNVVEETYQLYLKADADSRLGFILNALNNCKSFDDQCSLFVKWANSKESMGEDLWIVAVGSRLMDGEHYCPFLYKVWLIWRPLCQDVYYGMSRDSEIPNKRYNDFRARCYAACLRFIDSHPDDTLALNCASMLAGRNNINRYGPFSYGNQTTIEELEQMPNRYRDVLDSEKE